MSTAFPARLGGVTLICAYTKTLEEEMSRLEQTVQMFKIGGFVASPPSQPLQLVFVPILAPDYPLIRFLCFDNPIPLRGIATPKKVGFLISLPAPPYEKLCGDCASRLDIGCGGGEGKKNLFTDFCQYKQTVSMFESRFVQWTIYSILVVF